MRFERKKAEDCFSDSESYEYRVAMTGKEFVAALEGVGAQVRVNEKLRRPTFVAKLDDGVRLKGILSANVVKAGFDPETHEEQQARFERWMEGL
jgi:hypothetical protein